MALSKALILALSTSVVAGLTILAFVHFRDPSAVATFPQRDAVPKSATDAQPVEPVREASAVAMPKADMNWANEYNKTSDYFDFVSKAAQKAYYGDGKAALYISKALYTCLPIARQYAHSANPEADFNAYWANMTKAPQWAVDKARRDFQSCVGFIKGDAFANLPKRPEGYDSIRYWMDQASTNNDPVAQSLQSGSDISKALFEKSSEAKAKSIETAQVAINNAMTSKDPAAIFQIGQLLSDGHASSDPLQGFAVSIAACDLGYDCTSNNTELFRGCAAQGQCPPGINYSDVVKKAAGEDGYAQAYARAQQLEDALARGDTKAVQQFVKLNPVE